MKAHEWIERCMFPDASQGQFPKKGKGNVHYNSTAIKKKKKKKAMGTKKC